MMRPRIGLCVAALTVAAALSPGPVCRVAASAFVAPAEVRVAEPSPPLPLKVAGTHVVNVRGERVRLRGVNAASLEWTSDGEGHILETVEDGHRRLARQPRPPAAGARSMVRQGAEQTDEGKAYRALVAKVVDLCASRGCYIVLDLHWSDAGEWGKQIGQHVMPDRNSAVFWKDVAAAYKDHPAVIFDLYNEPHDVSWDVWLKGGKVTEKDRRAGTETSFEAVGMQALLDAVRSTGAKNVVIAGGLDWSYDLSGILDGRRLSDPLGNGVIYANHAYPFKGDTRREVGRQDGQSDGGAAGDRQRVRQRSPGRRGALGRGVGAPGPQGARS